MTTTLNEKVVEVKKEKELLNPLYTLFCEEIITNVE
jgi:hypothetical protein